MENFGAPGEAVICVEILLVNEESRSRSNFIETATRERQNEKSHEACRAEEVNFYQSLIKGKGKLILPKII